MSPFRAVVIFFLLTLCHAAAAVAQEQPAQARYAAAVARLGSDEFEQREAAAELLWRAGKDARPALEAAARSNDPETATRAKTLLEKLRLGIRPDTPAELLEMIEGFRSGDENRQEQILRQLLQQRQYETMQALFGLLPQETRQRWASHFQIPSTQLLALLGDEKTETLAEHLQWNALHGDQYSRAPRDYAAYLLLTGQLDAVVDSLRKSTSGDDVDAIRLLARLLQVQGKLAEAIALAKTTDDKQLQADLFYRAEDWAALSGKGLTAGDSGPENLGFSAAFHRLAGNGEQFAAAVEQLVAAANEDKMPFQCRKALMINDQWPTALDLWEREANARGQVLRLLCFQQRPQEGFRRLGLDEPRSNAVTWLRAQMPQGDTKSPAARSAFYSALAVVRSLDELGERDAALGLLTELNEFANGDEQLTFNILAAEVKLGLRQQAWKRAESLLTTPQSVGQVCYQLIPGRGAEARQWWQVLRQISPDEQPDKTLVRLATLLQPDAHPEFQSLTEKAAEQAQAIKPTEAAERFRAIAELCALKKEFALARTYFAEQAKQAKQIKRDSPFGDESPPHVIPLQRIGDMHAAQQDWPSAAQAYYEAWEASKTNAVPLYLRGHALVQGGHEKEGSAAIDRALLLPLADVELRRELAEAMQERGLQAEANKQWELILVLGAFEGWEGSEDWAVREACQQLGNQAEATDPERAGQLWQRMLFYSLKTNTGFLEAQHYADVVGQIHRVKALGLLDKGKTDEALREIELARAAHPGDIELVERALPKLIAADRPEAADKLFAVAFAGFAQVCRDFPNSARHHNDLAWLCARCDRRLDEALTHATRAVELAPKHAAYLDTLAEVHARRGDREQALRFARRALELEPGSVHLQGQVKRFGEK